MIPRLPAHVVIVALLCGAIVGRVRAQAATAANAEVEHKAVVELGAAADKGIGGGTSSAGATVAVEVTPIPDWLELESGITGSRGGSHSEVAVDLLIKKPFRLTSAAEFMIGAGPQLSRAFAPGGGSTLAPEVVLDFMFWPARDVGWYVEPSYSWSGGRSAQRSIGGSVGLLIGWP